MISTFDTIYLTGLFHAAYKANESGEVSVGTNECSRAHLAEFVREYEKLLGEVVVTCQGKSARLPDNIELDSGKLSYTLKIQPTYDNWRVVTPAPRNLGGGWYCVTGTADEIVAMFVTPLDAERYAKLLNSGELVTDFQLHGLG